MTFSINSYFSLLWSSIISYQEFNTYLKEFWYSWNFIIDAWFLVCRSSFSKLLISIDIIFGTSKSLSSVESTALRTGLLRSFDVSMLKLSVLLIGSDICLTKKRSWYKLLSLFSLSSLKSLPTLSFEYSNEFILLPFLFLWDNFFFLWANLSYKASLYLLISL